ncbi:MAG: aminomethyl-transferring glycine dehydrogenase subunit GcvPA [Chromatiales bacterium]|jgi:glycine dehydrogenase subunit 1|nr:aminomethyl-transferring glycine dehydrogenase subunit GcvPA [Chromatiales bacterium]
MPFIPHTEEEVRDMLAAIGAGSIDALFDEIPSELRARSLSGVPAGLSEMAVSRLMSARAAECGAPLCFIGAGAYEHHVPAAIWEVASRGEFYSAYTPYQAEASQGTLQLIYEFQTMMTRLTALDVSNASLYDGASALAEAVLMAVRANRTSKSRRVLIPRTVNPVYRQVAEAIVAAQGITIDSIGFDAKTGVVDVAQLGTPGEAAALIVQQPNFFGALEDADALTDWAHQHGMLVVGVVNPTSLALLQPPGAWGKDGADIACGEGQPLGIPLSSGGPYFGFMCCRMEHARQMPGRIVGRTVDLDGKPGYALTLQAREQHIRRSKATSNICTNQGLMVTAATQYMAMLGTQGLREVALTSHANTRALVERLSAVLGVERAFARPFFHEVVVRVQGKPVADVLEGLAAENILGGYALKADYPELGEALLVCATETRTAEDIERYVSALRRVLGKV